MKREFKADLYIRRRKWWRSILFNVCLDRNGISGEVRLIWFAIIGYITWYPKVMDRDQYSVDDDPNEDL